VIAYKRMPACEWSGESYDRVSGPQKAFGQAVLERLELEGSETVLDAGCGSGRVTELLLDRLPRGRVIAIDASESMVAAARRRLGARARVERQDLLELDVGEEVDAILSTATFHWIADHARLFARLHAALRFGGRLVAQCGGAGNISGLRARAWEVLGQPPYAEHFADWRDPWNYAGAGETEGLLLAAGFTQARCWLQDAPTVPDQPREFLRTVILGPHVQRLPEELRAPFLDDVIEHLGAPIEVDYVRLNIDAVN
jgi:trans-aconitate 2-methyltransferase